MRIGFKRRLMSSATLIALFAGVAVLTTAGPAAAACADDAMEDDDTFAQATPLSDPADVFGQACMEDADFVYNADVSWTSIDWFAFTVGPDRAVFADLFFDPAQDLDLLVADGNGQVMGGATTLESPESLAFAVEAGNYFLGVAGWQNAESAYELQYRTEEIGSGGGGSPTAFQQTSVNAIAPEGLSVTVQNPDLFFGDLAAGGASTVPVGDIYYTNNLGNGQTWSATVAATSLVNGGSHIPFSNMSFQPGTNISPAGPAAGGGGQFTGQDGTPGQSFSDPVSVVTSGPENQGSFTQSDSVASLLMPGSIQTGSYSGTFQYTITG